MTPIGRRTLLGALAAGGLYVPIRAAATALRTTDPLHARMMAALPFERVSVAGPNALDEWQRIASNSKGWPVVVGSDQDLERIAEQFSSGDPAVFGTAAASVAPRRPEEILKAAEGLRFPDDLARWEGAYAKGDLQAPEGEWPQDVVDAPGLAAAIDILSGRFLPEVHLLLIPTRRSWEIPAYLRWGGWNACPPPEHHVAALRSWHERYGAELVGITGDTLNVRASRRPGNREEAMALAREQYLYCPDIVDQGVRTLSNLTATLMEQDWWFFWWD